jgi:hypothetical protein
VRDAPKEQYLIEQVTRIEELISFFKEIKNFMNFTFVCKNGKYNFEFEKRKT